MPYGQTNPYSYNTGYICYVPYQTLQQINKTNSNLMVVEVDNIFNIEQIANQLKSEKYGLKVRYNQEFEIKDTIESANRLNTIMVILSKIVITLGIIGSCYFYKKAMSLRKKELTLLLADGLSKKDLIKLFIVEIIVISSIAEVFSEIVFSVVHLFCYWYKIIISQRIVGYAFKTWSIMILFLSIIAVYHYRKLSKISIADLIRENIEL